MQHTEETERWSCLIQGSSPELASRSAGTNDLAPDACLRKLKFNYCLHLYIMYIIFTSYVLNLKKTSAGDTCPVFFTSVDPSLEGEKAAEKPVCHSQAWGSEYWYSWPEVRKRMTGATKRVAFVCYVLRYVLYQEGL